MEKRVRIPNRSPCTFKGMLTRKKKKKRKEILVWQYARLEFEKY
jgi:hypothetical protein